MKKFIVIIGFLVPYLYGYSQVDTISTNIYQKDGHLGIGTTDPTSVFELVANDTITYPEYGLLSIKNNHYASFDAFSASNYFYVGSIFNGRRSRGTLLNPENIQPNDRITGILAGMYYDSEFRFSSSIEFYAGSELSGYSFPSYIIFKTTGENETERSERMRLSGNGFLGIGTSEPAAKLHVADGDIFIEDINRGVIMKSPDGRCWRGTLDNDGNLNFEVIDCPEIVVSNNSKQANDSEISIYPNPTESHVVVNFDRNNFRKINYTITNMNGQVIKSGFIKSNNQIIKTGYLSSGIYLINFYDKTGAVLQSKKFIKN